MSNSRPLIMTLLARDEEDIIDYAMKFHLEQGVDHIIVTDNLSIDSTPAIVQRYVQQGVATYIREEGDNHDQSVWVTRMARMAADRFKAAWVINTDADEFWLPDTGTLGEYFRSIPFWYNRLVVRRHDFLCLKRSEGEFWERMIYRKRVSTNALGRPLPPKCAHRGSRRVVVAVGNHSVSGMDPRPALRKEDGIGILHFPIRSADHYTHKIRVGGEALEKNTTFAKSIGATWREQYKELKETGKIQFLEDNLYSDDDVQRLLASGEVLTEPRLAEFFRARQAGHGNLGEPS